jgi:hypothetical protein
MAEWSEDHVAAVCFLNLNLVLVDDLWLNWRPDEPVKNEDRRLGRSGSGLWNAGTFKVVAPTCVG